MRSNFEQPGRPFDPENNYCQSFKKTCALFVADMTSALGKNVNPRDYLLHERLSFP